MSQSAKNNQIEVNLALVSSINGKLTNADQPSYLWASAEDQVWFEEFKQQHQVIIMGSQTYESARAVIQLSPDALRVVLTRSVAKYQHEAVSGQLEFSSLSPVALVESLKERGFTKVALVGGAQTAAQFLQAGLVSQLFLTLEPVFFSQGLSWDELAKQYQVQFELKTATRLNDAGTLLLHFLLV
jgi:dihydrofolate reductase